MKNLKSVSNGAKKFLNNLAGRNQKVIIELLQADKSPIIVSTELTPDCLNSEVSGTLSARLIKLRQKASKYKMNLGGFSFARKFDVKISMHGESASGTNSIGMGTVQFGISLQNNEKSFDKFNGFITELVDELLCGDSQLEGDFEDFKAELLKVA